MIRVLETTRFKIIPREFLILCPVLEEAYSKQGCDVVITGASYEKYEKGSYHDRGYAWDIRTHNLRDVNDAFAEINTQLKENSILWYMLYENEKGNEHFHIAYKYDKNLVSAG